MIELLRNCAHGSEICLYLVTEGSKKCLRKTACAAQAIATLRAEEQGWQWYAKRRYLQGDWSPCRLHSQRDYVRLDIDWIEGQKGDYSAGLKRNSARVESAVAHYCVIWGSESGDSVPLHGDFSIDNLLFNKVGVHVVDWEHFALDAAPWGFDAIYLVFETLWFGMRGNRGIHNDELAIIAKALFTLKVTGKLSERFTVRPLTSTLNFIRTHADRWGNQLKAYPDKLPLLRFSDVQATAIDQALHHRQAAVLQ